MSRIDEHYQWIVTSFAEQYCFKVVASHIEHLSALDILYLCLLSLRINYFRILFHRTFRIFTCS